MDRLVGIVRAQLRPALGFAKDLAQFRECQFAQEFVVGADGDGQGIPADAECDWRIPLLGASGDFRLLDGAAGSDNLRARETCLCQGGPARAEARKAAACAKHLDFHAVVAQFNNFHDFLPDANEASVCDILPGVAGLDADEASRLIHVAHNGAVGINPLIPREEGYRLVAQHQDDADGGENGQQAASQQSQLYSGFMPFELVAQVKRTRALLDKVLGQARVVWLGHRSSRGALAVWRLDLRRGTHCRQA